MATSIFSSATFSSFSNVSTTAPVTSCGPCEGAYIYAVHGTWAQNTTLPALRTIQPIINPVDNTTSTSVSCNPGVVPEEYETELCLTLRLGENCDLLCEAFYDDKGPFNITLSNDNGTFIAFDNELSFFGNVLTTDSAGASTCLTGQATLPEPSYVYYGPRTYSTFTAPGESTAQVGMVIPELTNLYPNEGLFKQCTYYSTGPPPIALTAANEIKLPAITLPRPTADPEPTPDDPPAPPPTTTPRPSNPPPATPSPTSVPDPAPIPDEPEDPEDTPPEDDSPEEPDTPENPRPEDDSPEEPDTPENPPAEDDGPDEPEDPQNPPEDDSPEEPDTPQNPPPADDSPEEPDTPANPPPEDDSPEQPPNNPQTPPSQGDTPDEPEGQPGINNPGTPIDTPQPPNDEPGTANQPPQGTGNGGLPAVTGGNPQTSALGTDISIVRPTPTGTPGFALPGPTITAGGSGVAISGTTFSALPSGNGIVAISDSGSTTLQGSELPANGINTVPEDSAVYVLPSQTLQAGGSAAVIDGTTYTVPGSNVAAAGSDQPGVVAVTEATNLPGIGQISAVDNGADAYVLAGSITVTPGGAAATISGEIYSALPSGLGVVVSPSSGDDTDEFAAFIEQGVSGEQEGQDGGSYVIGLEPDSTEPVTVSGVVYSVLPEGSGVLVVEGGRSTTVAVVPTESATGDGGEDGDGEGEDEGVVPFAGIASGLKGVGWGCYVLLLGAVGVCLL